MEKTAKKILFFITQPEKGGAQVYVRDLALCLPTNEFETTISYGEKPRDWLTFEAEKNNLNYKYFKFVKRSINPFYEILGLIEVYNFLRRQKFDIIHLNSSKSGVLGSVAARLAGVEKIIFTCHGWAFDDPRPWWERKLYICMYKIMSWFTDQIICVSEYARQAGLRIGLTEKKLITIHNGLNFSKINLKSQAAARELLKNKYQVLQKKFLIGTVANFYPTKGLIYLLEAAKLIFYPPVTPVPSQDSKNLLNLENTVFCIIGQGQEEKKFHDFIQKHKLQNNIFLIKNLKTASEIISAFDLFVLPSVKESFPYALLEAINAGLPVVATKTGGIPELLNLYEDKHYQLTEAKNPERLAWGIKKMIKIEKLETENLNKIKQKINLENMINKTKKVYLQKGG